jgi:uncharacterized membrane protein/predicted DsbA family dithiol-disulfide isomerase
MKRRIVRRALWAIAVLGLLGLALSIESYRELMVTQSGETTWCNFSEISNCEKAFQSEYSYLFGRPISLYGVAAYFLVTAIAVLGLMNGGPHLLASIFHLALMGFALVGATLYFGWALFFQVKTLCVLCLGDYFVNLSVSGIAWWACWKSKPPYRSLVRWDVRSTFGTPRLAIRTVVMLALFVVLGFVVVHQERAYYMRARDLDRVMTGEVDRRITPWAQGFPTSGPADAPIHAILFGDHQCPFCGKMKFIWKEIAEEYPGLVKITSLASPSNTDCNPLAVNNTSHPFACQAAYMAQAVLEKEGMGAFEEIDEVLYFYGPGLDQIGILSLGRDHGLTDPELDRILRQSKSGEGLKLHIQAANIVGVGVLPTMMLNGIKIAGYTQKWALLRVIEAELERKGLALEDFEI